MTTYSTGDVVRLKSGGPKMTVLESTGEETLVQCKWFDRYGKVHTDSFPESMLDAFKPRD